MPATTTPHAHGEATPHAARRIEVGRDQLPLHCPMPTMSLWNSHPRIYIDLSTSGHATCPYGGTEYVLKEDA